MRPNLHIWPCNLTPSQQLPAAPNAPPFPPTVQRSAPVASMLNYPPQPNASLHVQPLHLASQPPMSWPAEPSSDVALPTQQQTYATSHATTALSSGLVDSSPSALSGSSWASLNGGASAAVTPTFERLKDDDSEWTMVHTSTEGGTLAHPVPQMALISPPHGAQHAPVASTSGELANTRTGSKQKKPTVASSFLERQKKYKVSRRRGPLNKEKANNAHRMRKGPKRVCIRCKFYKSGVRVSRASSPNLTANFP